MHRETSTLVIVSGRPLLIAELVDQVDAVVAAWLPGSEGAGVADVLMGDIAFSGTSPYTWPRRADQLGGPIDDPLFAYGYGLTTDDS